MLIKKLFNFISLIVTLSLIIIWLIQGSEIFTKHKVLVDKSTELDKMLGVKNEVWIDKFIFGLDYLAIIIVLLLLVNIGLNYLIKTKKRRIYEN